jgi:hypothetical protein
MADERDTLAATKLTRTEFAVVRAYAQGMRPVDIANRYLVDPDDDDVLTEHQAVQRILALRDRLVQFALQHDRPDIAEMFEALRGRSDSGITRRVDALSSIEQLGQGRPLPTHQVSLWFGPNLARRLVAANIRTIADLVTLANRRGASWWRHVPRVGRQSAETILRWLRQQQPQLGTEVRPYVVLSSQFANIRPLYALALSPSMRQPLPLELMLPPGGTAVWEVELAADLGLVRAWLGRRQASPHTWKSYRREAERLVLWATRQRRSLRSLTADDLLAYQSFLADPQPDAFWCGPSSARDREHWRPFEGPLRPSSCDAALRVVRSLLRTIRAEGPVRRGRAARRSGLSDAGEAIAVVNAAGGAPRAGESSDLAQSVPNAASESQVIERFLAWLADEGNDGSPRPRAALAAALLVARHGVRIATLPLFTLAHVEAADDGWRLSAADVAASPDDGIALFDDVWTALCAHWNDRGVVWDRHLAHWRGDAALLAPPEFPDTRRGRAKRLRASAGYAASGLDRLLRASWRRFALLHDDVPGAFTPGMLKRAGAPSTASAPR